MKRRAAQGSHQGDATAVSHNANAANAKGNLLLVPTAESLSGFPGVPRQEMARHPHTSSNFSQVSGSSKSKPLQRASNADSLHLKLLKKTEKYDAPSEKAMLRGSFPMHQSQQTFQPLSMSNVRTKNAAAFLSPKAGARHLTTSGGLTFTSQSDSLMLKAIGSHQAPRESRANSNIGPSNTTSNLNNVASSTVLDVYSLHQ